MMVVRSTRVNHKYYKEKRYYYVKTGCMSVLTPLAQPSRSSRSWYESNAEADQGERFNMPTGRDSCDTMDHGEVFMEEAFLDHVSLKSVRRAELLNMQI